MIDTTNVKVRMNAAAAVIVRHDRDQKYILLIQRAKEDFFPNYYEFPRGKCDKPKGEDLRHCVIREVKEETGLNIIPVELIDTFQYLADRGTRLTTCYNFLCAMKDETQEVKLSKEHQDFRWISQVGEAELLLLPDQKKTVEKILSKENQIVNYTQNDFTKNSIIDEYLMRIQR